MVDEVEGDVDPSFVELPAPAGHLCSSSRAAAGTASGRRLLGVAGVGSPPPLYARALANGTGAEKTSQPIHRAVVTAAHLARGLPGRGRPSSGPHPAGGPAAGLRALVERAGEGEDVDAAAAAVAATVRPIPDRHLHRALEKAVAALPAAARDRVDAEVAMAASLPAPALREVLPALVTRALAAPQGVTGPKQPAAETAGSGTPVAGDSSTGSDAAATPGMRYAAPDSLPGLGGRAPSNAGVERPQSSGAADVDHALRRAFAAAARGKEVSDAAIHDLTSRDGLSAALVRASRLLFPKGHRAVRQATTAFLLALPDPAVQATAELALRAAQNGAGRGSSATWLRALGATLADDGVAERWLSLLRDGDVTRLASVAASLVGSKGTAPGALRALLPSAPAPLLRILLRAGVGVFQDPAAGNAVAVAVHGGADPVLAVAAAAVDQVQQEEVQAALATVPGPELAACFAGIAAYAMGGRSAASAGVVAAAERLPATVMRRLAAALVPALLEGARDALLAARDGASGSAGGNPLQWVQQALLDSVDPAAAADMVGDLSDADLVGLALAAVPLCASPASRAVADRVATALSPAALRVLAAAAAPIVAGQIRAAVEARGSFKATFSVDSLAAGVAQSLTARDVEGLVGDSADEAVTRLATAAAGPHADLVALVPPALLRAVLVDSAAPLLQAVGRAGTRVSAQRLITAAVDAVQDERIAEAMRALGHRDLAALLARAAHGTAVRAPGAATEAVGSTTSQLAALPEPTLRALVEAAAPAAWQHFKASLSGQRPPSAAATLAAVKRRLFATGTPHQLLLSLGPAVRGLAPLILRMLGVGDKMATAITGALRQLPGSALGALLALSDRALAPLMASGGGSVGPHIMQSVAGCAAEEVCFAQVRQVWNALPAKEAKALVVAAAASALGRPSPLLRQCPAGILHAAGGWVLRRPESLHAALTAVQLASAGADPGPAVLRLAQGVVLHMDAGDVEDAVSRATPAEAAHLFVAVERAYPEAAAATPAAVRTVVELLPKVPTLAHELLRLVSGVAVEAMRELVQVAAGLSEVSSIPPGALAASLDVRALGARLLDRLTSDEVGAVLDAVPNEELGAMVGAAEEAATNAGLLRRDVHSLSQQALALVRSLPAPALRIILRAAAPALVGAAKVPLQPPLGADDLQPTSTFPLSKTFVDLRALVDFEDLARDLGAALGRLADSGSDDDDSASPASVRFALALPTHLPDEALRHVLQLAVDAVDKRAPPGGAPSQDLRMLEYMRSLPPAALRRVLRDNSDVSAVAAEALLAALPWVDPRDLLATLAEVPASALGQVGAKLLGAVPAPLPPRLVRAFNASRTPPTVLRAFLHSSRQLSTVDLALGELTNAVDGALVRQVLDAISDGGVRRLVAVAGEMAVRRIPELGTARTVIARLPAALLRTAVVDSVEPVSFFLMTSTRGPATTRAAAAAARPLLQALLTRARALHKLIAAGSAGAEAAESELGSHMTLGVEALHLLSGRGAARLAARAAATLRGIELSETAVYVLHKAVQVTGKGLRLGSCPIGAAAWARVRLPGGSKATSARVMARALGFAPGEGAGAAPSTLEEQRAAPALAAAGRRALPILLSRVQCLVADNVTAADIARLARDIPGPVLRLTAIQALGALTESRGTLLREVLGETAYHNPAAGTAQLGAVRAGVRVAYAIDSDAASSWHLESLLASTPDGALRDALRAVLRAVPEAAAGELRDAIAALLWQQGPGATAADVVRQGIAVSASTGSPDKEESVATRMAGELQRYFGQAVDMATDEAVRRMLAGVADQLEQGSDTGEQCDLVRMLRSDASADEKMAVLEKASPQTAERIRREKRSRAAAFLARTLGEGAQCIGDDLKRGLLADYHSGGRPLDVLVEMHNLVLAVALRLASPAVPGTGGRYEQVAHDLLAALVFTSDEEELRTYREPKDAFLHGPDFEALVTATFGKDPGAVNAAMKRVQSNHLGRALNLPGLARKVQCLRRLPGPAVRFLLEKLQGAMSNVGARGSAVGDSTAKPTAPGQGSTQRRLLRAAPSAEESVAGLAATLGALAEPMAQAAEAAAPQGNPSPGVAAGTAGQAAAAVNASRAAASTSRRLLFNLGGVTSVLDAVASEPYKGQAVPEGPKWWQGQLDECVPCSLSSRCSDPCAPSLPHPLSLLPCSFKNAVDSTPTTTVSQAKAQANCLASGVIRQGLCLCDRAVLDAPFAMSRACGHSPRAPPLPSHRLTEYRRRAAAGVIPWLREFGRCRDNMDKGLCRLLTALTLVRSIDGYLSAGALDVSAWSKRASATAKSMRTALAKTLAGLQTIAKRPVRPAAVGPLAATAAP